MTERGYAWTLIAIGLVMVLAGGLGGCATAPDTVYVDRVVYQRPHVAPSLLHCTAEPAPLGRGARQGDGTTYTLDAVAAGRDCRRKLGTVAKIVGDPS